MTFRLNADDTVTIAIGEATVTMTMAEWSYILSHPVRAIGSFRPLT